MVKNMIYWNRTVGVTMLHKSTPPPPPSTNVVCEKIQDVPYSLPPSLKPTLLAAISTGWANPKQSQSHGTPDPMREKHK